MSDDTSITAAGGWCAPEGTPGTATLADAIAATAGEPQALRGGIKYPSPDPVQFPAPRDMVAADMVENTAEEIQAEYPYRTLLDCRELAGQLVDAIMTWDANWPEAEGDCGCVTRGLSVHMTGCLWRDAEAVTMP